MSKITFYLVLACFLFCACKKNDQESTCNELSQNPVWPVSVFKTNYTIQFPPAANYRGGFQQGFEGSTFSNARKDSSAFFIYNFCSSLFCNEFGNDLASPEPNSISGTFYNSTLTLKNKIYFCENGNRVAVFYFADKTQSVIAIGKLYWKVDQVFKEAVTVSYQFERQQEVIDILKTIKHK